jgi:hypothetical protein
MEHLFQTAWQPFTPRGVARFAGASFTRLLLVELVFALLAAAVVTWCVRVAWCGTVTQAIEALPERGEIRAGRLEWTDEAPRLLADGRCLSVVVDLEHGGTLRGAAHVQVELGRGSVRVFSILGYVDMPYPAGFVFALNRPGALPWWGAWSPVILAGVFAGTTVTLLLVWAGLAWFYAAPVWLLAFFANRAMDFRGAWRLSGAAQMPGALMLTLAVVFYGLGFFDPVRLLVAFGGHFVPTWVYLAMSPLTLPSAVAAVAGSNPFGGGGSAETSEPAPPRKENPFSPDADQV